MATAGSSGESASFLRGHWNPFRVQNCPQSLKYRGVGRIPNKHIVCRFKRQAGEFWLSWDPYWTKSGPQMQRVFHEDGSVLGMPSHEPFWFQDSECRCVSSMSGADTLLHVTAAGSQCLKMAFN